jgi:hypothetical protein
MTDWLWAHCPRCEQLVRLRIPKDGYTPPKVWHLACFDAYEADLRWLAKRQPELVLLGDDR